MHCPNHLQEYVEDASSVFPSESSSNHRYYRLRCGCGNTQFRLDQSQLKTVKATCKICGVSITIYDLDYYPAAVKLSGVEVFEVLDSGENQAALFVMFEYGVPEPDVEFDANDITWCQIFIERSNGEIDRIFDDETC